MCMVAHQLNHLNRLDALPRKTLTSPGASYRRSAEVIHRLERDSAASPDDVSQISRQQFLRCNMIQAGNMVYNARQLHSTAEASQDEPGVSQIIPRSLDLGDDCGCYSGPLGDIGPSFLTHSEIAWQHLNCLQQGHPTEGGATCTLGEWMLARHPSTSALYFENG